MLILRALVTSFRLGTQVPFEYLGDDLKAQANQKDACSVVCADSSPTCPRFDDRQWGFSLRVSLNPVHTP